MTQRHIGILGAGPAGLMAAEAAANAGARVTVFDAMPSVGRKFLMAGKSGLNITHSEPHEALLGRFRASRARLETALNAFTGDDVRTWADRLGVSTFVGSSGRVFPDVMKGSPLLRAWLKRLDAQGVAIRTRHRWIGWAGEKLVFATPEGEVQHAFDAVVFAFGGASWPRLGSDAAWVAPFSERGIEIAAFRAANCAFERGWSPFISERFAGHPVKSVVATSALGGMPGEFVVTPYGVEGSLIYAHSAALRDAIEADGSAVLTLDLVPGRSVERLAADFGRQPSKVSFTNRLRKAAGLDGVKAALVRELAPEAAQLAPEALAIMLKSLPLRVENTRSIAEAISVAGGVVWDEIDPNYMLKKIPGTFVAGEMIDWEAPTGGYLLTASMATGRYAGLAAAHWEP
ncbi:TIGR03862 family flavoprotein [Devosia sp. WQ 349]|uniref:TIGR03862 family flavoprotein n=1 Tax=Devosia sp. WQ 349K1 TaxID=2800329 RepID=UPI001908FA37|nr:TIGR03862 family flavoprotein [Devosia sp. WQ 349K1]MBK1794721.1 TIGR03862 family flavoprotein [Devosia sp. WQ 349K1]